MRFHEDRYPDFYIENLEPFEKTCHATNKNWRKKYTIQERTEQSTLIRYWRDVDGAKKKTITVDDYCFQNWPKSRRFRRALPLYYQGGYRFIRVTKAKPVGYNYAKLPVSLAKVYEIDGVVFKGKC